MSESTPNSDADPLVTLADQLVERIRNEMGDTWRRDSHFLEKFFPIEASSDSRLPPKDRKRLYNDKKNKRRWKAVPTRPKSAILLCTPLRMLMNEILRCYGISRETRLVLDTHSRTKGVISIPPSPVSPSLFLAGVGDEFANTPAERPQAFTQCGISPIEILLDSDDFMGARDRLAVNVHQMFKNQANRRFAYGLVITETMLTMFMFDHSGAVTSEPFNYHQQPEQFCAVLAGLASDKAERMGFDSSIFSEEGYARIRTFEPNEDGVPMPIHYNIKGCIFQFPSLVGRGTICWRTSGPDGSGATFVVKDAWIAPEELAGRDSEGSLLRHAQKQGVLTGVVQVRHFEEILRGANPWDLDSVLRNRRVESASAEEKKLDRVHTRIVMETHGKTLDEFANRKELVLAFHDAVLAHRKLHDAGILHRDISVRNILINPEGVEGDRGILIDFDHAIRVGDTSPYSEKTKIGTRRYMSRNVLNEEGPHTYLDDLESFYYVLCWVLVAFERPDRVKIKLPEELSLWDLPASGVMKQGHIASNFVLPVDPWFRAALRDLPLRLHRFFRTRRKDLGKPLSALNPTKDYDDFLALIRQCIAAMEADVSDPDNHSRPSTPERDVKKSAEPAEERRSENRESSPRLTRKRRPLRVGMNIPVAVKRPRREKTDYGDNTSRDEATHRIRS